MTEIPGTGETPRPPARGRWWRVIAMAAVLLALSQTLWWWQTWPVRELLRTQPPAAGTTP